MAVKGICFENGMFCIGDVQSVDNFEYHISGLLQLTIGQNPEGQSFTTFQHLNPFVNESDLSSVTDVNRSKIVFLFHVDPEIKKAYDSSLSKLIVPEQQGIIMPR